MLKQRGLRMEIETRAPELTDFCLVLTPTLTAAARASEAVRKRFTFLPEETRREVASVVAELVETSVERRPRKPITVVISLDSDAIRGEVYDQGDIARFEIPLAPPSEPDDAAVAGLLAQQ
jgi:hypothetical protein